MRALVDRDLRVPMRDGVALATDVYRPAGRRWPVLLSRTPYGTDLPPLARPADGMALVEAGYAVVLQDVRVDVGTTATRFRCGHRGGLEIAGSNFPRFDLCPGTGPAQTQVHHGPAHRSHPLLPIHLHD